MEVMRTATKAALILQPDRSTYELNERQVVPCGLLVPSRDRSKALDRDLIVVGAKPFEPDAIARR